MNGAGLLLLKLMLQYIVTECSLMVTCMLYILIIILLLKILTCTVSQLHAVLGQCINRMQWI